MKKPLTVVQQLKESKKLINTKEKWIQGAFAEYVPIFDVHSLIETHTAYCAIGAIQKVDGPTEEFAKLALCLAIDAREVKDSIQYLQSEYENRTNIQALTDDFLDDMIPFWNDKGKRTHKQVMATFDKAVGIAQTTYFKKLVKQLDV